jgi:hypothetical protein
MNDPSLWYEAIRSSFMVVGVPLSPEDAPTGLAAALPDDEPFTSLLVIICITLIELFLAADEILCCNVDISRSLIRTLSLAGLAVEDVFCAADSSRLSVSRSFFRAAAFFRQRLRCATGRPV